VVEIICTSSFLKLYIVGLFQTLFYFIFSFVTTEGEVEVMKEKVELDDEKKLVILTALEGHCLNLYKNYKIIFQVTPKTEGGSVKITLEYEKLNENIPPPNKYLDLVVNLVKDLDAHILKV
jgi:hypothetical protein